MTKFPKIFSGPEVLAVVVGCVAVSSIIIVTSEPTKKVDQAPVVVSTSVPASTSTTLLPAITSKCIGHGVLVVLQGDHIVTVMEDTRCP